VQHSAGDAAGFADAPQKGAELPSAPSSEENLMSANVKVFVRGGDVVQALRRLKKACAVSGVVADMRRGEFFRKPSDARRIRHLRAVTRQRKVAKLFG
jgi:ribosomal protein S21